MKPAAVGGALPATRFQHSPARATETFKEVACNFDRFAEHRIISNEQDPVLNAYRVLRTRVLQKMEENNWRTIAVVSPGSGAGKTVTAINLAIAAGSKLGSPATLVDLDFYRPRVAQYLGVIEPPSILDYFEGLSSLTDVTVKPDLPDLLLIGNERVSRRGAEHLTSAKADELIARTVNDFGSRIVLFDMSPMLGCDDTIAFLPKVDCALVVVASGQSREPEIREAMRLMAGINIVGVVLNKAPPEAMIGTQYY
ncbi:MAG: CpsD/CapB family tyrosine-protein kinase [Parvularculaceae bacterium]|nr:CpsD/CapB family tyrosine-protein kinase [Parvularculaceae bacterium]